MTAVAGDLTTVARVKLFLGITNGDDDAVLQMLVTSCSSSAGNFLNRNLLTASYTEFYDGNNTARLLLKQTPITAVTLLTVGAAGAYGGAQPTIIPASPDGAIYQPGYGFDAISIFMAGYTFWRGVQNIKVQYTAGYPAAPYDVEEGIIEWVADRYKYRQRVGEKSKAIPQGGSVNYETAFLPDRVKSSLSNYKRNIPL